MRKFLLHLLFWITFFLVWNRMVNFYVSNVVNRLYFSALDVALIASGFYIIYVYIMPDYLRRKSISRLFLLSGLLVILLAGFYSWLMGEFLHHALMPINFHFYWDYKDLQYNRFLIALVGVLAGCFVKLAVDRLEVGRRMEAMEKEKSLAELTYLKTQINPHFLFNSLNSLYTQLDLTPEAAKGTLVSLADLLRYQLYECNADFIPVAKELAYLQNYFNLQSIRNDNCTATLLIEGDHKNALIAPLLLIPFVENAFKYVSDYDGQGADQDRQETHHGGEENYIKVRIDLHNKELHFSCINTFDASARQNAGNTSKGIGLINVRKRLELIYGDGYRLQEEVSNVIYNINLTLTLK